MAPGFLQPSWDTLAKARGWDRRRSTLCSRSGQMEVEGSCSTISCPWVYGITLRRSSGYFLRINADLVVTMQQGPGRSIRRDARFGFDPDPPELSIFTSGSNALSVVESFKICPPSSPANKSLPSPPLPAPVRLQCLESITFAH